MNMVIAEERMLGKRHELVARTKSLQVQHLKQIIINETMSADECASVYTALMADKDNPFSKMERFELAECVSQKMHDRMKDGKTPTRDQKHMFFENYLSDEMWVALFDKNIDTCTKLKSVAEFAQRVVGVTKPCERTCASIVSIVLCATRTPFTPAEAKSKIDMFKTIMKHMRRSACPTPTLHEFPEDADEFVRLFGNRYEQGKPPVPSRLSSCDLFTVRNPSITPCRSSALSLRMGACATAAPSHSAGAQPMMDPNHCMNLMMQFMMGNARSEKPPTLLSLATPKQSTPCVHPQGPQKELLAIAQEPADTTPAKEPQDSTPPALAIGWTPPAKDQEHPNDVIDDMQAKVRDALSRKRGAGAVRVDCSDVSDHEPLAKKIGIHKKPAGNTISATSRTSTALSSDDIRQRFPGLFVADMAKGLTRGAFTSRAYGNVKRRHGPESARVAYALASNVWDAVHMR